jgi:ribosomal protein S21
MSKVIKVSVTLDKKKCTDKAYFDKAYKRFSREVLRSGIAEDLRFKKCYYKPSALRKLKKQFSKQKWKFYN